MAGFTSFASTAMQVLSVANTVAKGIDSYRDNSGAREYDALRRQGAARVQALQNEAELRKLRLDQDTASEQEKRRRAVLAAIARQKAAFGASGIGSGGGSAQAYLLGLVDADNALSEEQNSAAAIQKKILDLPWQNQKRINTLALTEAREKNRIRSATSLYDAVRGGLGSAGGSVLIDGDGFYS